MVRFSSMARTKTVTCVVCVMMTVGSAHAQVVRGRVVDEPTRTGIQGAVVTVIGVDSTIVGRAATDGAGFFRINAGALGEFTVTAEIIGFARYASMIVLNSPRDSTIPAIVLHAEAVPLAPVEATAKSARGSDPAPVGFSRARFLLSGSRMKTLEEHGGTFKTAVLELGGTLRVREGYSGGRYYLCIHAIRGMTTFRPSDCQWPALVIDDIEIRGEIMTTVRSLSLADYESIEYLPPAEAGNRYGIQASTNGAIVLWSRGRGPHRNTGRN